MRRVFDFLKYFVPLLVITTALCGLGYMLVQQTLRQEADDPQIQIAEDIASDISAGRDPKSLAIESKTDMSKSLSPYVIIFDDKGVEIASSVQLDGKTPIMPAGVFEYARLRGQHRVSWEPKDGIRSAAVISKYAGKDSGFVLVGRSMREIDKRQERILKLTVLAWFSTVSALIAVCGFFSFFPLKKK